LNTPVLYLSRFINQSKGEYYKLLQSVRDDGDWEQWILYILDGIEQTSHQTIHLILGIRDLMQSYKYRIREELPKIYSHDLLNNLFRHPYTKIDFVMQELQVTRITATKYLDALVDLEILSKHRKGKENYYMNDALFNLLLHASSSAG
jgi:Fic family protein